MKQIIKLISCLLLVFVFAFSLSACGKKPDGSEQQGAQEETKHTCEYKVVESFDKSNKYPKKLVCKTNSEHVIEKECIEISNAEQLKKFADDCNFKYDFGCYTFKLTDDIDLKNTKWTPITLLGVTSIYKNKNFVFDGNGKTISNFKTDSRNKVNSGLFGEINGEFDLTFKNLNIKNANISADLEDVGVEWGNSTINFGIGALIGNITGLVGNLAIENCTVSQCTIEGAHWAGGLIGFADGPDDFAQVDYKGSISITNCKVEDTSVLCNGSAGSIVGHATGSRWLTNTISDCQIKNNIISCTGSSKIKAGSVMGTVGAGTVIVNNCTQENIEVTSGGEINDQKIFGRFGDAYLGKLTIDGVEIPNDTPVS